MDEQTPTLDDVCYHIDKARTAYSESNNPDASALAQIAQAEALVVIAQHLAAIRDIVDAKGQE
jgi:hypothetical protein